MHVDRCGHGHVHGWCHRDRLIEESLDPVMDPVRPERSLLAVMSYRGLRTLRTLVDKISLDLLEGHGS